MESLTQKRIRHIHDVCLVNSRDAVTTNGFGIAESITSNAFGCFFGDELDRLHDAIDDLSKARNQ